MVFRVGSLSMEKSAKVVLSGEMFLNTPENLVTVFVGGALERWF